MKFETKLIHAGQSPDSITGALAPPLITSTTFAQKIPGKPFGFEYSRVASPTRQILENCFCELEGGTFALALSSGCAAMTLVLQTLKPKDILVAEKDLYGGTLRLLKKLEKQLSLQVKFLDFSNLSSVKKVLNKIQPQMIWLETPTNPLLKVLDISRVAEMKKKSLLVVDSTFATPCFQKPLDLGADVSLHSATKYIGGHTDVLGGLIVVKKNSLKKELEFLNKTFGSCLAPFDSYLLLRSLKTLSVRMKAHTENALKVAEFLEKHKQVKKVIYPFLKSHPQYSVAKNQMSGAGGVVSFYLNKGHKQTALKFLQNLKVFTLAESLGTVESLVEQPFSMTHQSFSSKQITPELIRLSVGLEHSEDLIEDLNFALKKAR